MTDPFLLEDPDSWKNTMPDMAVVSGEPEPDLSTAVYVDAVGHRRPGRFPAPLLGIGLTVLIVCAGIAGYVSHRPAAHSAPITNVTTTLLPRPTVTRPGHTVRLPGPTVTRHLRASVTVRVTRTVPGPRVTVTATPTDTSGPVGG